MAQQVCHDPYVRSVLEDVGRETMSCTMPGYMFADTGGRSPFPEKLHAGGMARKSEE